MAATTRCRSQRPYPLDSGDPMAVRRVLECDLSRVISYGDLLVQLSQLFVEALKQLPAHLLVGSQHPSALSAILDGLAQGVSAV